MSNSDAFWIMAGKYSEMDYPYVSLEECARESRAKHILHNAMLWVMGGSETQRMRLAGIPTPDYPSSVPEEGVCL